MWVNKDLFQRVLDDNKAQAEKLTLVWNTCHVLQTKHDDALCQKAKDDITIDWMRHRLNALEKERAILLNRVGGIVIPIPEIVPSRPGTISELPMDMTHLPSFEDVGDTEATRLGISHDNEGNLKYKS